MNIYIPPLDIFLLLMEEVTHTASSFISKYDLVCCNIKT